MDKPPPYPPLVSFIMAAKDAESTVRAAILSALAQTYENIEVVVVDDGSTDETWSQIQSVTDSRLLAHRLPHNLGRGAARNVAVDMSSGEYLAILDSDDRATPARVELTMKAFELDHRLVMVGGQARFVDPRLGTWRLSTYPLDDMTIRRRLAAGEMSICHGGSIIRRAAFEAVGGYNIELRRAQDFDLAKRLAALGKFASIPQDTLHYLHPVILPYSYWAESRRYSSIVSARPRPVSGARLLIRYAMAMTRRVLRYLRTCSWRSTFQ